MFVVREVGLTVEDYAKGFLEGFNRLLVESASSEVFLVDVTDSEWESLDDCVGWRVAVDSGVSGGEGVRSDGSVWSDAGESAGSHVFFDASVVPDACEVGEDTLTGEVCTASDAASDHKKIILAERRSLPALPTGRQTCIARFDDYVLADDISRADSAYSVGPVVSDRPATDDASR